MNIFLTLAVGILMGWWASSVAGKKGRSPVTWAILGFLFGLIGVIIVYILPDKSGEEPSGHALVDGPGQETDEG